MLAAPTISGSTGLIRAPSADVLRQGQFSGGYYFWPEANSAVFVVNAVQGLELGLVQPYQHGTSDPISLNFKYALMPESVLLPAIAIGVEDIDGRNRRSVYGVISKGLPFGFRLHLGTGTGHFDGFFFGLEKVLNPASLRSVRRGFPVTSLIVEFDGNHMNYGARFTMARGLRLDTGWQTGNGTIYLGMTFTQ